MSPHSRKFRFSIRLKIAFYMALLVILIMGVVTYIFTIRELNMRVEQMKTRMQHLADNIASIRSMETEDWDAYQIYLENQIKINRDIVYILMKDENDEVRASVLNDRWIELEDSLMSADSMREAVVRQLDEGRIAEESRRDLAVKTKFIIMGNRNIGIVKVGFSLVELNNEKQAYLYRNFNYALVFIVIAVIFSLLISHRIVTPLTKLTGAMMRISRGDLDQTLDIRSKDEIGEMARTFNFMTKGLREKRQIEDFSRQLGFAVTPEEIEHIITRVVSLAAGSGHGILFLEDEGQKDLFSARKAYPPGSLSGTEPPCISGRHAAGTAGETGPREIYDPRDFGLSQDLAGTFTAGGPALLAPILFNDEIRGYFLIGAAGSKAPFSDDEKAFFMTLVRQSGFALENVRLLKELTRQERFKHELEIGRHVQQSLLPAAVPDISSLDIDGICLSAAQVGGDYYDYFMLDKNRIGITIADVSGKGVSAAFYMAVVKGMMAALARGGHAPGALLTELNDRLFRMMNRNMFITMSYAVIDTETRRLTLARAGHNSLVHVEARTGRTRTLTPAGIGLGLAADSIFASTIKEISVPFSKGDVFIFYTDGISEAMNACREEFGEERLQAYTAVCGTMDAGSIRRKIIEDVAAFTGTAPQSDDMTMIVLKAR